jgi:glycine betaine/proline transport system ATP-binding protein
MTTPAVQFEHVDVLFGDQPAAALALLDQGKGRDEILERTGSVLGVHDACLSIGTGEICVLMGLSGSGKSSLLRCVNGLNAVTRGRVLVAAEGGVVDVAKCEPAVLRRLRMNRISMVFQQFALMPWRSIRENVGLGLELRGLDKAERRRLVDEKLSLVRLDQWADKRPHELSGGMQQRVGLARALATDADILLMDEPFSALDPLIREHLQDELLALQARLGKTIIFVSHDLDEALKIGGHIAIMEGGRIVQAGPPADIISRPATDYVRAFVANVNPLNVMNAGTLMRPFRDLARTAGENAKVLLDDDGEIGVVVDEENRPRSFETAEIRSVAPGLGMRELAGVAMEGPVAVIDETGRLVGAVGPGDLLGALSQRPTRGD